MFIFAVSVFYLRLGFVPMLLCDSPKWRFFPLLLLPDTIILQFAPTRDSLFSHVIDQVTDLSIAALFEIRKMNELKALFVNLR